MVYVGELFNVKCTRYWTWDQMCHMTADSVSELRTFADKIGLRRWYYHPSLRIALCHYDLNPGKRRQAIEAGAQPITRQEAYRHLADEIAAEKRLHR